MSLLSLNLIRTIVAPVSILSFLKLKFNCYLVLISFVLELNLNYYCIVFLLPLLELELNCYLILPSLSPLLEFNSNCCCPSLSPLIELELELP